MDVPISWIKDYVEIGMSPDQAAHALTMAGLETNNLGSAVPDIEGVITARIEKIDRHPDADKLTVCKVKAGDDGPTLNVVCGAPNIKEGNIVPLATVGTTLPGGFKLKKSKIRGVESQGMMCSERELGISQDHSGIWILPENTPIGQPLAKALGADDAILSADPTPNRGDLMSVIGIAREISAITGAPLALPPVKVDEKGPPIEGLARVDIEDYDGCPRYVARLILGVKIGPSPDWMAKRLEAAGMRPINNIVDVTNYVMLETGQPLHAFDYRRLHDRRIVVKTAKAGEKFTTLDGQEHALRDDTLMICDGGGYVAIAGVMGGLDSEVTENTVDVLLESAFFKPTSVRRTARLLGVPSEASRRFDKGVDPLGCGIAADRAIELMARLAGGEVARGSIDAQQAPYPKKRITVRPARVNRVLGIELSATDQAAIMGRLHGIEVKHAPAQPHEEIIEVTAPSYRPDLAIEEDMIEEIARLVGYDNIPDTMPRFRMEPMKKNKELTFASRLRQRLAAIGFSELVQTNFEDPKRLALLGLREGDPRLAPVKLANPLSDVESILRTTLVPKLLENLKLNRSRGFTDAVRVYEINAVFQDKDGQATQRAMLGGVFSPAATSSLWEPRCEMDGFPDLKGAVEEILGVSGFPGARMEKDPAPEPFLHPGKSARLMVGKELAGRLGEVHPRVMENFDLRGKAFIFELDFDMLKEHADYVPKAKPVSKFPANLRDIAIVVDESVTVDDIIRTCKKLKSAFIESISLFDIFRGDSVGEGKKSMAFHVTYQSLERTLSDEEVSAEHNRLAEALKKEVGAALR